MTAALHLAPAADPLHRLDLREPPDALDRVHQPDSAFAPVPPGLPDDRLDVDQLGSRIVGLAGRIAAETCRWLLLIAAFDARDGCDRLGQTSTAHWLAYSCGLAARTAREYVRVARALAAFPDLAAAMGRGVVSYSHARAVSRAVDPADPASAVVVADLLEIAEHGTVGQLESIVRGLRTADDDLPDAARQYVRQTWTQQSMSQLSARLDPENGAVIQSALDVLGRAHALTAVEALVRMAEIALVTVNDTGSARPLRGDERAAVVVHLDAASVRPTQPAPPAPPTPSAPSAPPPPATATAGPDRPTASSDARPAYPVVDRGGSAEPPTASPRPAHPRPPRPYARLADGPGLPDRVVSWLICAGRIRTVVRDVDGTVLDLGRTRRLVSDRQFRALLIRQDSRCAHPGCRARQGLEAHHVRHWLDGGRTDMANLVLLCLRHHHAHHDGEFTIRREGRQFVFTRTDGRELPEHPDPEPLIDRLVPLPPAGAPPTPSGDRLDRPYAVSVLATGASGSGHARAPVRTARTHRDRDHGYGRNPDVPAPIRHPCINAGTN